MKKVSYERIIRSLKIPYKPTYNEDEMVMRCIDNACPNPHNHLFMNKRTGAWICHRCGVSGNMITFLRILKSINTAEAKKIIGEEEAEDAITLSQLREKLYRLKDTMELLEDKQGLKNIIYPPKVAKKIKRNAYPSVLIRRKIPYSVAKYFRVAYCNSGKYTNRLIFPFTCNGHRSVVAYATNKYLKPKTLNPPGSYNKDLLFGYDIMEALAANKTTPMWMPTQKREKTLLVVEGIFDFLRVLLYGYRCVALLKSHLSKAQATLLNDSGYRRIVFLLDGDVTNKQYETKLRHKDFIDSKPVHIARIPSPDDDPDKLSAKEIGNLIKNSIKNSEIEEKLLKRLKRVKKM